MTLKLFARKFIGLEIKLPEEIESFARVPTESIAEIYVALSGFTQKSASPHYIALPPRSLFSHYIGFFEILFH